MPHARIGDIDIHYEVSDYTDPWLESETVLLHHGFARNLEFWREWVPLLARDYRVVRFTPTETAELAMALKGVSDEVRTKVTSNMSERASENLLEEVELLGAVLLRQVEEAQVDVIRKIRELEESGEIILRRGADEEFVA